METPQSKALKKINYTGTHEHSHHKGGLMGALKGLQNTKYYGIKRRERHKDAIRSKGQKERGEMPF